MRPILSKLVLTLYLIVFLLFLIPWVLYVMEYPDLPAFMDPRPHDVFVGTYTPWGFGHWKYPYVSLSTAGLFFVAIGAFFTSIIFFIKRNICYGVKYLYLFLTSFFALFFIGWTIYWLVDGTY